MQKTETSPVGLLDKTLIAPPTNWEEWLLHWNESNDPMKLAGLLHMGPTMKGDVHRMCRCDIEPLKVYLRSAQKFWDHRIPGGASREWGPLANPQKYVATTAFKALTDNFFSKPHQGMSDPCHNFIYEALLLDELMNFFGVTTAPMSAGVESFHSLLVYSGKRADIVRKVSSATAFALLRTINSTDFPPGWREDHRSEDRDRLLASWRKHSQGAVTIIITLSEEYKLYEYWLDLQYVDQWSVLRYLREWVISRQVYSDARRQWEPATTISQIVAAAKNKRWLSTGSNEHAIHVLDMYHGLKSRASKTK